MADTASKRQLPRTVTEALDGLCYRRGFFVPVLEADITGYLYYLLVKQQRGRSSNIHISARIPNNQDKRKYPDLVIGEIWSAEEQAQFYEQWVQSENARISVRQDEALRVVRSKGFQRRLRPVTADINTAIDIKPFLKGFNVQQLAIRFGKAKQDLQALAQTVRAESRVLLVFDEIGYLDNPVAKPRLRMLREFRDSLDPAVLVVRLTCDTNRGCTWDFI